MIVQLIAAPSMSPRPISPSANLPGQQFEIVDGNVKFALFVPDEWRDRRRANLTIHFHGATWYAIQEHLRRKIDGPIIAFSNGEGSSVYKKPFLDQSRFRRWVSLVESRLHTKIDQVNISSFSAGYGAVREILRNPANLRLIHRIVLGDSMYAGFEPIFPGARSQRPAIADFDVWIPFARLACEGKKEFILTHSLVATPYAASYICARWLSRCVGVPTVVCDGVTSGVYPLLTRSDRGSFHIWGYGGTDGAAHIVHARHLADVWNALDQAAAW